MTLAIFLTDIRIMFHSSEAFTVRKALAEEELKSRQHEREKEAKARILVKEVIYYTVFILFLACVIYTNQDRNTYLQKENIMNTFFGNTPEVIIISMCSCVSQRVYVCGYF